jgi:anti-sigma regulatory factor (Ser/Thr protein kinase)
MRSSPGTGHECLLHRMALPAVPQAAGIARDATRDVLESWGLSQVADDAILLVSELVGNAIRHAFDDGSDLELGLAASGTVLRIEVCDPDPQCPQPRSPAEFDDSGFGFVLVQDLASQWGVTQVGTGKAVWAELSTGQEVGIAATQQAPSATHAAEASPTPVLHRPVITSGIRT